MAKDVEPSFCVPILMREREREREREKKVRLLTLLIMHLEQHSPKRSVRMEVEGDRGVDAVGEGDSGAELGASAARLEK